MNADLSPTITSLANDVDETVFALAYLSIGPTPAPVLYEVLSSLQYVGHGLAQALDQLAGGLAASLDVYDVYDDDGGDPAETVTTARAQLGAAAEAATQLGQLLADAHETLSHQGHRTAGAPR